MHGSVTTAIVLPTYNERENLTGLVERLMSFEGLGVLVVDDASPDGTGVLADELAARHTGRVQVLHRTGPRGLGRSYVDGLQMALEFKVPRIVQMDADWSHDPAYLPELIEASASADLVIGSRYLLGVSVVNWPLRRVLLSAAANRYIRMMTSVPVHDCTSGFRCWRRDALARLPLASMTSDGYAFLTELLVGAVRAGCSVAEVPIIFVERRAGASKVSRRVIVESFLAPWKLNARRLGHRLHIGRRPVLAPGRR